METYFWFWYPPLQNYWIIGENVSFTVTSIKKSSYRKFCESGDRKGKDVKAKQSVGILPPCCLPADISNSESGQWLKISQYLKRKMNV